MLMAKLISSSHLEKTIMAMMYRHPGAKVNKFIENYYQCLEQQFNEKKTFCILGDVDINVNERLSQAVNHLMQPKVTVPFNLSPSRPK